MNINDLENYYENWEKQLIKKGPEVSKNRISGQVIFRDAGPADHLKGGEGKRLMIVVGIVAVGKEAALKGESQYTISGIENKGVSQIDIHMRTETDLSEKTIGMSLDGMVKSPVWRI